VTTAHEDEAIELLRRALGAEVVCDDGPTTEHEKDVDRLRGDHQKSTGAYAAGEDQEGAYHR
jgi:hypothetical protein